MCHRDNDPSQQPEKKTPTPKSPIGCHRSVKILHMDMTEAKFR